LRIEEYFQQIQNIIATCRVIQASNATYDKRGTHEGLIRGEIYFVDGSVLHFREAVDTELMIDRLMYVYQYMTATKALIFRYDNTGHHKRLNLPTYPHHKHEGGEENVIASSAPELAAILREVESREPGPAPLIDSPTFSPRGVHLRSCRLTKSALAEIP
jgi:hypothetical protein